MAQKSSVPSAPSVVKFLLPMISRSALLIVILSLAGIFAAGPQAAKPADPAEAARLNNLGTAYMNQQLFEKALKAFQDAAAADPKLEIAQLNQGIALLNLGKIEPAKAILEAAVKASPGDPHAWYNLAMLYKNTSATEAAESAFQRVLAIDPNDADTWYFLGTVFSQLRQFPQAIDGFHHALALNPLHASAEFGLARALQQSGDATQAREHLQRFQHITQDKLGSPISLAYGEQGKYSLAEQSPLAPQRVLPEIPVKFIDVTRESGLATAAAPSSGFDFTYLGPGACFLDYDGDGSIDIFLPGGGSQGGMSLYRNLGNGKFEDVTRQAGLDPSLHGLGCAAGDYDNDGFPDLAVTAESRIFLFHNEKNGSFKDVSGQAGVIPAGASSAKSEVEAVGVTFVDYDHDGDLDLYVTRSAPAKYRASSGHTGYNIMWRNNGNGTFTDVTDSAGLSGNSSSVAAVGTDFNNDRAVDLVVTGWPKGTTLFENPREGTFRQAELWPAHSPSQARGVALLDFDHDGWMDLAITSEDAPALTLWRNHQGTSFEPASLPDPHWLRAFGVAAFDYDNDGWVDLVAVGETKEGKGEAHLFRNLGRGGFKDVTAEVGLDKIKLQDPRAIITGDLDNDGATDLLITQSRGPTVLLRNQGGNKNHWLRLALTGLNDNKSAIGTKVEVFSDGIRQKFEVAGSSGYLGANSPYLTIGLGQASQAEILRMLWPSGVLEDEVEVAGLRQQSFTELDRRGSSCPTLFAWNGERYELVGDMLGAGVVGHWIGPHQRDIPRPVEYMKINRGAIREKNGKLSFRFMEPLEEAVYLDQVNLLAVDHPAGLDVYPNEYFADNPPYPEFKVILSRNARPPAGAWDGAGHNVLPDLLAHRYIGGFDLLPFKGFTKLHSLELDLGQPYDRGPLWLLMHGEIEYFTATGMYAAWQSGLEPISPYVEALGADGKWRKVVNDLGFPAGGPRTMTADLTGKLPRGTRRIRIWTNLQIYWDSILIDRASQKLPVRLTPLPLTHAQLDFHGFPLKIEGHPPGNVKYIYEQASATGPYTRPAGLYTRYGNVLPLLTARDDRMAVFGSGDEVALEFDPAHLPALPSGWVRDYFFAAHGYEKDMDFYAAEGETVRPLPFRKMTGYPYPARESFPLTSSYLDYVLNYNTRYMSGKEARGYSFDYPSAK